MKNMNIERRKNISNFIVLVCGKSSGCFCLPNNKPVTILYMRNSCYFEIWSWIIHVSAIRLFMPLLLLVLIRITFARTKKSPYQKKKKKHASLFQEIFVFGCSYSYLCFTEVIISLSLETIEQLLGRRCPSTCFCIIRVV